MEEESAVEHVPQSLSVLYVGIKSLSARQPPTQPRIPAVMEHSIASTNMSAPPTTSPQLTQILDQSGHQRAVLGVTLGTSVPSTTGDCRVTPILYVGQGGPAPPVGTILRSQQKPQKCKVQGCPALYLVFK
jgi:hypothetical protein